jgi:GFO/IDH/MocA oxidoreductase family protein
VFSDHEQLVTQPDIDVVAVTVKVPHHRELVSAALAAGKAVYCEWPLGRDLDDARAMAALAAERGVRTVVGLQTRHAPAIEFVQELVNDGYVGKVLPTTVVGLSVPGDVVVQPNAYMLDETNGPSSPAWRERPPTTSRVPTRHSRQTSPTGLTLCRTSLTPSGGTRSSPPSRGPRHQGNA